MATLIGMGSHYDDMVATFDARFWRVVKHHSEYVPENDPKVYHNAILIAVNDPRLRAAISAEIGEKDGKWIHPNAYVGPDCKMKHGTHINYGVTMTRTTIGHHCTISPGVTICGDVTIGDRTMIGAGVTIGDRVTIGSDCRVGMGAVVLPEAVVPDGETWVGVPARRV